MTITAEQMTPEGEQFLADLRARLLALAEQSEYVDYDPKRRTGGVSICPTEVWRGFTYCSHTVVKLKVLAVAIGQYYLKMLQGSYTTSTSASAGTHAGGGAGDAVHSNWYETIDNWVMNLAREVAFLIYWDRDAISGVWSDHGHFIDPSCPNLSPEAAAQVVDFHYGRNGLANDGPDFGSRKTADRMWSMYLNRSKTTVASIEALFTTTPTPVPEEDDMPLNDADVAKIQSIVRAVMAEKDTAVNLFQKHNIFVDYENENFADPATRVTPSSVIERSQWGNRVWRTDADGRKYSRTVKQELAELTDSMGALMQQLQLLRNDVLGGGSNPPEPDPAFTLGFDMSGWQTVEQVQAAAADPSNFFGIIKCTEGQTGSNSKYAAQMAAMRASGRKVGHYHYAWQNQDPIREAQNFLSKMDLRPGDCWFVDIENWDSEHSYAAMQGVTWEQRFDYYMRFRAYMEAETGSVGSIYPLWTVIMAFRQLCKMTSSNGWTPTPEWREFTRAGLWLPQYFITINGVKYVVKPGQYDFVSGGWDVFIHQYTSTPFDKNWMPGGPLLWAKHAVK